MPKKKRTLKQKQSTDQRRLSAQPVVQSAAEMSQPKQKVDGTPATAESMSFSLPAHYAQQKAHTPTPRSTTVTIATDEYAYLGKDLAKTVILTISIVVAEILIHVFAK